MSGYCQVQCANAWRRWTRPLPRRMLLLALALPAAGYVAETATDGEEAWFRGDTEDRTAAAWVRAGGGARVLRRTALTADRYPVGTVICCSGSRHEATLVLDCLQYRCR